LVITNPIESTWRERIAMTKRWVTDIDLKK
jgi:hypothetical protein